MVTGRDQEYLSLQAKCRLGKGVGSAFLRGTCPDAVRPFLDAHPRVSYSGSGGASGLVLRAGFKPVVPGLIPRRVGSIPMHLRQITEREGEYPSLSAARRQKPPLAGFSDLATLSHLGDTECAYVVCS